MPEPSLTPEEKLLRIIESPQGVARPMKPVRASLQDFKFSGKLLSEKYGKIFKGWLQEHLNIKAINFLFLFLALCATAYICIDFPMGVPTKNIVAQVQNSAKKFDIGDLTLGELEPLAIFTQEITQRNIFSLPESAPKPVSQGENTTVQNEGAKAAEVLTSSLKLVGIIWSDVPQAIIEDTKESRTHLVSRASKIGRVRVKDILKDRVVLSYDNQEIELK